MQMLELFFRNERTTKALFGISREKFEELAVRMEELWFQKLAARPNRQRKPGAGQPSKIPTGRHKLAYILFYVRVYPTFDVMVALTGINNGDCCRWMHDLLPLLEQLLGEKQVLPKRKINSIAEFASAFPQAAEVMVDATERPVQRSKKKRPSRRIIPAKRRDTHAKQLSSWIEAAASAHSA